MRVIGQGPAGASVACAARRRGHEVEAWDPRGVAMPPTIGCWASQIPDWIMAKAKSQAKSGDDLEPVMIIPEVAVCGDGWRKALPSPYAMIDPQWLAEILDCGSVRREAYPISTTSDPTRTGRDDRSCAQHFRQNFGQGLDRNIKHPRGGSIEVPSAVVDTSPPNHWLPVRQIALGLVVPADLIPEGAKTPTLMDLRTLPDSTFGEKQPPWMSFSYRMPLGNDRWLIEETIVSTWANKPFDQAIWRDINKALDARLLQLGMDADHARKQALRIEEVDFPLGPYRRPLHPAGAIENSVKAWMRKHSGDHAGQAPVIPWGSAAGTIHAATGYSIGMVLSQAEAIVRACEKADERKLVIPRPANGWILGWLHRRGLRATLDLTPKQTRNFYREFFALSSTDQMEYFIGSNPGRVFRTMAKLLIRLIAQKEYDTARELFLGSFRRFPIVA